MLRAATSVAGRRVGRRALCSKQVVPKASSGRSSDSKELDADAKGSAYTTDVKVWGANLELPEVTKQEVEDAFANATDPVRGLTPPVSVAVEARDDMLKDRFNFVSQNVTNPAAQYVVMGGNKEAVVPAAIGQGSFLLGTLVVFLGGVFAAVYIKTQWGVATPMELGDKLREKGAAKREQLERSTSARMVRTVSQTAEASVKTNVEIVRRPTQQMGEHFEKSFKGVVREGRPGAAPAGA